MRRHVRCQHTWDKIIIEEGKVLQCSMCGFFGEVAHYDTTSVACQKYKARCLEATKLRGTSQDVVFTVNGVLIGTNKGTQSK
jgi:hypothetical protein